ncbi:MAG: hypothetical protein GXY48_06820 [Methanomicrobiales archaeon]|nr:hypothetical protein [Methanomicrobiales archaeon]
MTRKPNALETAEVLTFIESSGQSLISRNCIVDTIGENPLSFPAMIRHGERTRGDVVSQIMNQRFPLLNQTGKKPAARVWIIQKQTGVHCATC